MEQMIDKKYKKTLYGTGKCLYTIYYVRIAQAVTVLRKRTCKTWILR